MIEDRPRLRHSDRWIGLLVVAAVALFLAAVLQAGVLREWLRPSATLLVLLPEEGSAGLSAGADVEVLGTRAGTVRRVVIEPDQRMRAEVRVEEQAKVFIRRDSRGVIRKRFGVAGAAYLDIERGTGEELDWNYAVIEATSERAPTETVSALLDTLRDRVLPIVEDLRRVTHSLASTAERLERGEGSVGRLLADDALAREAEGLTGEMRAVTQRVSGILETLEGAAEDARRLTAAVAGSGAEGGGNTGGAGDGNGGIPALLQRADRTLASLQRASRDLARATPALPRATRSVEQGAGSLPMLLLQTQETARELELLVIQLRGLWVLGGGGGRPPPREATRPGADRVRP